MAWAVHDAATPIGVDVAGVEVSGGRSSAGSRNRLGLRDTLCSQLFQSVVTIERVEELAEEAKRRLISLKNVKQLVGDGSLGSEPDAPFDAILVTARAPEMPQPLYHQLKPGGRMVIPFGGEKKQTIQLIRKGDDGPAIRGLTRTSFFKKLVGAAGWEE